MDARIFSLTSEIFEGEVVFEFTDDVLTKYDASNAQLNEQQIIHLAKYLPRELAEVRTFLEKSKTLKFTETTNDISFDMFWKKYFQNRLVDNSSKKRTRMKWEKMNMSERLNAYRYINKYLSNLSYGTFPKHAETYLNAELWNN